MQIAIIGAGPLGLQLALQAARAGFRVALEDVMPANLRHAEEALRQELGAAFQALAGSGQVRLTTSIEDSVRNADLAIDCVPDELESKLEIFSLLDRMAPPRTVFATPTTHLSIADLASCTYRATHCVALVIDASQLSDPNLRSIPVHITGRTDPSARELIQNFWVALGYEPQIEIESAAALSPAVNR